MRPIVCVITDRHRLGSDWQNALVDRARVAAACGVHLIQVREPDLDARTLFRVVERCVDVARGTRARVIVNDRADVAVCAGAHGVHLRTSSYPAHRVRSLVGPNLLVGRSVHSLDEAAHVDAEGGLDYLIFGTVFDSLSKIGVAAAGADTLAAVARATALPVLAVGGVTARTAAAVAEAGAAGFAAIGLFLDGPVDTLGERVTGATDAFSSAPARRA